MDSEYTPTKANLIKSKEKLNFSKNGFSLLDKKRTVLIREAMALVEKAEFIQKKVDEDFKEAYEALKFANITLGINDVENAALSFEQDETFEILYRSVMGLDIPVISFKKENEITPKFSFIDTNAAIDIAAKRFNEIKYLVYEMAEIENSVYKISMEIKKTAKRANALEKIQIPKYMAIVKYIEDVIEEKDREDFFRLKKVKKKNNERHNSK